MIFVESQKNLSFFESFRKTSLTHVSIIQVYPLVVAIGGAVVLCTAACTRYLSSCPDVTWGKGFRGTLHKGEQLQGRGKSFGSHRHGWDTGSNLMFGNGNGYGKKNYQSTGDEVKLFD